jgi:hypothetical protein
VVADAVLVVAVVLAVVVVVVLAAADVALVADVAEAFLTLRLLLFHQVADADLPTRLFRLAFGFQTAFLSRFLTR